MNVDEILDSYVSNVVKRLPRRQRVDVALELKSLLADELAGEDGTRPTPERALELLRAFGRPADVAVRYRPAVIIIDPADSRVFLRAAVIGVAIIWLVGLLAVLRERDTLDGLQLFQRWYTGAGLPALWWPGFLVVCSAVAAWVRRRWPRLRQWSPRPVDRDRVNRFWYGLAVIGAVAGIVALAAPRLWLDAVFGGRAAAQADAAFAYDSSFVRVLGPAVLVVVGLDVALLFALLVRGRWQPLTRRIDIGLNLATCALLTWILFAGKIFQAEPTNQIVRLALLIIVVTSLIAVARKLRAVRLRSALAPQTGRPAVR